MRQSIINKGVNVPDTEKLDTYYSYIDQIMQKAPEPEEPAGDGTEWGTLYTSEYPSGLELQYEDNFAKLGKNSTTAGYTFVIDSGIVSVNRQEIVKFSFGSKSKAVPDYFLYSTPVTNITCLGGIEEIGVGFCASCSNLNCPINLPAVRAIGSRFLYECENFRSDVALGPNLEEVYNRFMGECDKFTGLLTVKATDTVFLEAKTNLATSDANAPMFSDGVRITGAGADLWVSENSNLSGPSYYRNLIKI